MNFVKNYNRNWNLNRNFLIKKIKPKFIVGILAGLIISLILSFIENELLKNISFISFGILSLIFVIYSGLKRKWLNLIIGLFAFVSFFSKLKTQKRNIFLFVSLLLISVQLNKRVSERNNTPKTVQCA